ncbi:MAG: small subunit ribosomal protein [Candidatus Parcubacteria bacterium]|jgi:small subunit ribosomal protein S2
MPEEKSTQSVIPVSIDPAHEADFKEMIDAGVFFGRRKSKVHPRMKPYILHNRNGIEVINLQKTRDGLQKSLDFLRDRLAKGATVLIVATQPILADSITELATAFNILFVTNRWLGGTITNFSIISKRIEYLKKLKKDLASGAFDKYTKKERVMIEKEMRRLEELLGGVEMMTRLPDVMIVVDPTLHKAAVLEARRGHIPVIALTNVDSDPDYVDHMVLGNTNSIASVGWFLKHLRRVFETVAKTPVRSTSVDAVPVDSSAPAL